MATYKVIQNIEAEDKFLGPLTFKQFIFAAIAAICIYLGVYALIKGIVWVIVIMIFPTIFASFLAFPWGRDQTTELWLLAKIRYMVKPRLRIWNQAGQENLVTITAPIKVDKHLTKDLTPDQVQSRLKALATTIDSHGWAIKNVDMIPSTDFSDEPSDRLIHPSAMPRDVPSVDVEATQDVLDETSNPLAKKLDGLMDASAETHHQQVLAELNDARHAGDEKSSKTNNNWFMNNPDLTGLPDPMAVSKGIEPGSLETDANTPLTDEEKTLLRKIHEEEARLNPLNPNGGLPAIKTTHESTEEVTLKPPPPKPAAPMNPEVAQSLAVPAPPPPPPPKPVPPAAPTPQQAEKRRLATNNDRSIESLAREVNKKPVVENKDGEVIISLH